MIPPADNSTSLRLSSASDATTTRATFDILSTCLSTLLICVWSTVHIDIPPRKQGALQSLFQRLRWMVIGVFVPEWLLYIAVSQFIVAVNWLKIAYSELEDLSPPPDSRYYRRLHLVRSKGKGDDNEVLFLRSTIPATASFAFLFFSPPV